MQCYKTASYVDFCYLLKMIKAIFYIISYYNKNTKLCIMMCVATVHEI